MCAYKDGQMNFFTCPLKIWSPGGAGKTDSGTEVQSSETLGPNDLDSREIISS